MKILRFTDSQFMVILKQNEPASVCVMSAASMVLVPIACTRRAKFGGMDTSLIKRIKGLEDENRRLKKYAEVAKDIIAKNR